MTVYFTADLHFGHRMVAELRGYESPQEHDEALCDAWSATVKAGDQVWVLGDLAVSSPVRALEIITSLPGVKHLIAGNHDGCHPMHRDSHKKQRAYLEAFASVQPFARRKAGSHPVLLSHFPYAADHSTPARYTQYRLRNEGLWLLHGHTHGTERLHDGREFHVGWDAWRRLVSLDEIAVEIALQP